MIKLIKKLKHRISGAQSFLSPFHIEADRSSSGLDVLVGGVKSIVSYSDNEIVLKTVIGSLCIMGVCISLSIYDNQTVKLSGRIEEVKLAYSKN